MDPVPALSVVILNYNYGSYLPGCIQSILGQTFGDFELVVVDDCSTDNSVDAVRPFLDDRRVRVVRHEKNAGFTKSLIEGTEELSRGEFRTVISADDLVRRNDAFAIQIGLLRAHPAAAFCFSAAERFRSSEPDRFMLHESFPTETILDSREALVALLTRDGVWPVHSGTIVRASAYQAAGGYRRDITMPLDLAMWLALAMQGGFAYSSVPLYGYRLHESQMSAAPAKIRLNTKEVVQILREACREGEKRGYGTEGLFRRAINYHLGAPGVVDAFEGNPRSAMHRWLAAVKECPIETVSSRKLWVVAARAAFGEIGFSLGRRMLRTPLSVLGRRRGAADDAVR